MSALKLTPQLLLNAYCQGVFPMAHEGDIYWYDPDPRAILPLDQFHVSQSLQRTMKRVFVPHAWTGEKEPFIPITAPRKSKKRPFTVTVNRDFAATLAACADPDRTGAWINEDILRAYNQMHTLGWAHSMEVWQDDQLVGGLYGVAIRGLFAGEAMFHHVTDASKVALVVLVDRLRKRGFTLLDVQFQTKHLARFGVVEIGRDVYKRRLQHALQVNAVFDD